MMFPKLGRHGMAAAMAMTAIGIPAAARAGDVGLLQGAIGNPGDFHLSGSTRLRYEAIEGESRPGFAESEDMVSIRTILSADYRTGNVRFGAELYDSRAYDIEDRSVAGTNEINTFELVQAYGVLDLPNLFGAGSKASVQAGRMMLNLGSRRLIAADDYRNTTNGYTGIRFDTKFKDGFTGTLYYMLPQLRLPDDGVSVRANHAQMDKESFDAQLWGGLFAKPRVLGRTMAEIGYVGFAERDAPLRATRDRHLQSVTGRLIADPVAHKWDYELEGIYQFGSASPSTAANAVRQDVSAWFMHADLGYSFGGKFKTHLSVEYDYVSGDGPGGANGRFDTLFGMRRADFAPPGLYAQIGRANISTPGVRLEVAPGSRLDAFTVYRAMWLANKYDSFSTSGVRDASGRSGSFAGHQLEARVRWWAIPRLLRTEVNGVLLVKGRFLKDAPNAPRDGDVRYVSVATTLSF